MSRKYKNLKIFQKADEYARLIYLVSRKFPKDEIHGIVSQLRRSALSIPLNIVEGSAKDSEKEYLRFLVIALGSASENAYLVDFSEKIGFLTKTEADTLRAEIDSILRMPQTLIRKIRSSVKKPSTANSQ